MPDTLAVPSSAGELYDARSGETSLARPLMQGDVLRNIDIPGLEDGPGPAIIMMHPCSMRTGSTLRKRLTVVRVGPHRRLALSQWPEGDFDFMPLPDLMGECVDDPPLAARFRDIGSVKTAGLDLRSRIAVLSTRGLLYLQQRYVYSQTRVVVDLETLLAHVAPVLDEVELQEGWVEAALEASAGNAEELEVVRQAEGEFQDFMGAADSHLRRSLREPLRRSEVRRAVRAEAKKRYPAG